MKAFIIHGAFGNPEGNWFRWLESKLKQIDYDVVVPRFPVENYDEFKKQVKTDPDITPQNQSLQNWFNIFQPYFKQITADTMFIGHSLGLAFILRILEKIDIQIKACVFTAGFLDILPGYPEFNAVNRTFIEKEFDWKKIKKNCKKFICIGSDDDSYVPQKSLEKLAEKLGVDLNVIRGGKHLSEGAGMVEFPMVLDMIKSL